MQHSTLLFLNIGTPEMMLILGAALFLFGGKKLPELARGLGKGIREFKDASEGVKREIHNSINQVQEDLKVDTEHEHTFKQPELPQTTGETSSYSDPYHHYYAPPVNSEPIDPKASIFAEEHEHAEANVDIPEPVKTETLSQEPESEKINPPVTNRA